MNPPAAVGCGEELRHLSPVHELRGALSRLRNFSDKFFEGVHGRWREEQGSVRAARRKDAARLASSELDMSRAPAAVRSALYMLHDYM